MTLKAPDERKEDITKTGFERFAEQMKELWHDFKQEKIGLIGLALLLFVATWGITGNIFGEQNDTLYSGDSPPAAAPRWAASLGKGPVEDQSLISQDFNGISQTTNMARAGFDDTQVKRKGENATEILNTKHVLQNDHLELQFSDTGQSDTNLTVATQALTKSFHWDEEWRPPNNYIFHFDYKYGAQEFTDRQLYSDNGTYSFTLHTYIKAAGYSVTNMRQILEEGGTSIPPRKVNKEYGISWAKSTPKIKISSWTQKSADISLGNLLDIFNTFEDLQLSFVATFSVNTDAATSRSAGTFKFFMDDVKLIGRGYYRGIAGTTAYGGDLFTLIAKGMKNDIALGLVATSITLFLGIFFGLVAGYLGGGIDEFIMRLVDFLLVLPQLPIMIVLAYVFSASGIPRTWGVIISISFITWAGLARFIRSQVLSERERPYVEAAKASGSSNYRIMFGHIFPNIIGIIIYQVVLTLQGVILTTAALAFLGLGPDYVSFGMLLQQLTSVSLGQSQAPSPVIRRGGTLLSVWWFSIFPGLILFLFGTGLVFVGMTFQRIIGEQGGFR